MDDTAKVANDSPAVASDSATSDSVLVASLPSAPEPKVKADPKLIAPHLATQPFLPMKPVFTGPRETPRQRKVWYGLALAGHSGAAFDAWTTHRAVVGVQRHLCSYAGEPGGDGLLGQADDGEPAWLGTEDWVAATNGGREHFIRVRRA